MWKPDEVVPEHRWRARLVWAGLLMSIFAYTIWQICKISAEMQDPSTSLEVTHEIYEFPFVLVCFAHRFGCGYADESIDTCVEGARESALVYDWNGDVVDDIVVDSTYSNCVGFDLANLNAADSEPSPDQVLATLSAVWIVSDTASTETEYFDRITVFMSDVEPTDDDLSYLGVPFSRILPEDETLIITAVELTIGKTTKKDLSGGVTTIFPPLVLSESHFTMENPVYDSSTSYDYAVGMLYLTVRQGDFSRTTVEEKNPLDIGNFLGNIGGFWELLILFWGLFFIAIREERKPKLKARDFVRSVQVGKEIVTRRRSLSVDSPATPDGVEERPAWEAAYRGDSTSAAPRAAAIGFPSAASNGHHGHQNSVSSSSHGGNRSSSSRSRRPIVFDAPLRGSRYGSDPPEDEGPAPPSYGEMAAL